MVAKSLRHKFVSAVADSTDTTLVRSQTCWNDDHNFWLGNRATSSTTDTLADTDHFATINYNSSSPVAVTLPAPTGSTFLVGWTVHLINQGSGAVTITLGGSATINARASLVLAPGMAAAIFSDGTNYSAMVVPADVPSTGAGRLSYVASNQIKFTPYNGAWVKVNGVWRQIPSGGVSGLVTGVYLNGVAGQTLANSTFYYVYLFDNAGTPTINYSTGGHVTDTTAGNVGVEVHTSSNIYSLIGMVYVSSAGQFNDTPSVRNVASWFNRRPRGLQGTYVTSSTTSNPWFEVTGTAIYFLPWADSETWAVCTGGWYNATAGKVTYSLIGLDGATTALQTFYTTPTANYWSSLAIGRSDTLTEGLHRYSALFSTDTGGTANFSVSLCGGVLC